MTYRPAGLRSSTSAKREGNLSMLREISRASQGSGLRIATEPSLSMITNENPRGCRVLRSSDPACGSVSVTKSTSRACKSSRCGCKISIWRMKDVSSGLSEKTTTSRWTYSSSAKTTLDAGTAP